MALRSNTNGTYVLQGVLEPGSGQELVLTVWINGGLKGTAQLAAETQVRVASVRCTFVTYVLQQQ